MKEHLERIQRIQELCSRLDDAIEEARTIREAALKLQTRPVKPDLRLIGDRRDG